VRDRAAGRSACTLAARPPEPVIETHVRRSTQPMTCRPPFTPLAALSNRVRVALSQPRCSTRLPRTSRPWLMSASSWLSALLTKASSRSA